MDKAKAASLIQKTWRNHVISQYRKLKEVVQAVQEELHQHEEYGGVLDEAGMMFGGCDY